MDSLICDTSVSLWEVLTIGSSLDIPVGLCTTIKLSGSIRNCLLAWVWKLKFPKEVHSSFTTLSVLQPVVFYFSEWMSVLHLRTGQCTVAVPICWNAMMIFNLCCWWEGMAGPSLEVSMATLDKAWSTLIQWKVFLPMAGSWNCMHFNVPSNPNLSGISVIVGIHPWLNMVERWFTLPSSFPLQSHLCH